MSTEVKHEWSIRPGLMLHNANSKSLLTSFYSIPPLARIHLRTRVLWAQNKSKHYFRQCRSAIVRYGQELKRSMIQRILILKLRVGADNALICFKLLFSPRVYAADDSFHARLPQIKLAMRNTGGKDYLARTLQTPCGTRHRHNSRYESMIRLSTEKRLCGNHSCSTSALNELVTRLVNCWQWTCANQTWEIHALNGVVMRYNRGWLLLHNIDSYIDRPDVLQE